MFDSNISGALAICEIGADMTNFLGVWLYEPQHNGKVAGLGNREKVRNFPSFIPKTDQERIQNKMAYFKHMRNIEWEVTKKLDGSSLTVFNHVDRPQGLIAGLWYDFKTKLGLVDTFGVASRNIQLKEVEGNAYWEQVNKYGLRDILKGHDVAIQGEMIGPRINGGREGVKVNDFYVFDIYDIHAGEYMNPQQRMLWLETYAPNLKHVPIIARYKRVFEDIANLDTLQMYVSGQNLTKTGLSEGMVFKSCSSYLPVSFKCISNQYLLKGD